VESCLLVYRASGMHSDPHLCEGVLLAVKNRSQLLFYVHRSLDDHIADEEDRKYIEALIPDLLDRADVEPEAVFTQLNELSSGPLVARDVEVSDYSAETLRKHFPALLPLV
jgi:hypothetical protein